MDEQRLSAPKIAREGYKALRGVEAYLHQCGLEKSLIDGCAYCLNMHSKDARRAGETEQRLYVLNAWHEASIYTPRERAALAWTEALTHVAETHAPDDVYAALRPHFSEKEIVDLTILIGMINLWNRLAIGMRNPVVADGAAAAA